MVTAKTQKRASVVGVFAIVASLVAPVVASAAANSANTTITATVNSVISITSSSTVAISLTPTPTGVVSSASDTITVNTNNTAGYVLTFSDQDTNTNLVKSADNIAAHAGTQTTPTALASNTWGYRVVSVGGFGAGAYSAETNNASSTSTWAGVPSSASPNTLKTTAAVATNDTTTVWYGVKATSAQPNGAYSDVVTYTATTN